MLRRRLVAGESLDRAISASTWNDLLSLLDHRDANGLWMGSTQQQPASRMNRPGVVYVRNNTGSNLSQFSIVGIGGPAIDSNVVYGEFQREVILSAVTPDATHYGKFAVTIDAIPAGECGLACVSGVVQCKVDLDEEAHRYADLEVGNVGALVSRQSGSAEILWRLSETGDGTWCIVRLGNSRYAVRKATASASIAAGASGSVAIKTDGKDDETATAYYTWADDGGPTIDNGDEIYVAWIDDERKWYIFPPGSAGTSTSVPTCILFNGNAYNGDSSSKNKLYYYGVSNSSNRVVYVHFINGWGDLAGVGVDVMATASSVGAGTHAATDASFKLTQGGLYRFIIGGQVSHDATKYEAVRTETGATASGGSPAHTHSYTYLQERVVRSSFTCDLQWRNTGGGAWQTTAEQMRCVSPMFDLFSMPVSGSRQDQPWQIEAIMWQNHNQVDREYRLRVTMSSEWDSWVSGSKYTQAEFVADTGLIAITRLADYAADQTLTP